MKARLIFALALAAVCLFSGCSSSPTGVDELLRAPQFTGQQSQVQKALAGYLGESPQLKYPTQPSEGQIRSPFVFADWNGDGKEDAAVLYVSSAKGQNVHLAILEQGQNGNWAVTQEKEGLSTAVESITVANMQAGGSVQLLVGYAGTAGEKYLAVYSYGDNTLNEVYQQAYSQYALRDLTGSGANDLVIIGPEGEEGLQPQLVTSEDGQFNTAPQLPLKGHFTSCEGLYASKGDDGSYYLVLDGRVENTTSLASAILHYDARLGQLEEYHPLIEEDLYTATQRYSSLLKSRDVDDDGSVEIPHQLDTALAGTVMANRLAFICWMDYTSEYKPQKSFGVADLVYGYYLELPAAWQDQVILTDGQEPDSWDVRSLDGQNIYLSVRVVAPSVQGGTYFRLGNIGAQKVQARILAPYKGLSPVQLTEGFFVL